MKENGRLVIILFLIFAQNNLIGEGITPVVQNEIIFNYSGDTKTANFENELVVEKEFDVLKGIALGFESLTCLEDLGAPTAGEEFSFSLGFGLNEMLNMAVVQKILLSGDSVEGGLDLILCVVKEFEKAGIYLGNENEFLFNQTSKEWEYANTLGFEKSFKVSDSLGFLLFLENEYAVAFDRKARGENSFKAGPGINYQWFGFQIRYVMGISSEIGHGLEGSFLLTFE